MTPETVRLVSQLRDDFYAQFSTAMIVPVNLIRDNSSASTRLLAFWLDESCKLNYALVYAHCSPDDLMPQRPLILRVSLNIGATPSQTFKSSQGCQGLNQDWCFQLTLLPDEILDFSDWMVQLTESNGRLFDTLTKMSPHPLEPEKLREFSLNIWTQQARKKLIEQC